MTITMLVGACSDAARPARLEDALLDAADLGSTWSESPSHDRPARFDWCTGESTPIEDRTEVAFIAWSNDEAPGEVVGERIERYSGTGAKTRVAPREGLPCDYVEAGTTVRVSEQAGAGVGDESHVYLMEAIDGPDKGTRFVWQVQVRNGDTVLLLSLSSTSSEREVIDRVVRVATDKFERVVRPGGSD